MATANDRRARLLRGVAWALGVMLMDMGKELRGSSGNRKVGSALVLIVVLRLVLMRFPVPVLATCEALLGVTGTTTGSTVLTTVGMLGLALLTGTLNLGGDGMATCGGAEGRFFLLPVSFLIDAGFTSFHS